MTIEEFIIEYLATALAETVGSTTIPFPVSGDVPSPVPDSFLTVEQTAADSVNKIRSATIAIESWHTTRANAAALNARVEAAMEKIIEKTEISSCSLDTSYNNPDMTRKKPRYQADFTVVYNL